MAKDAREPEHGTPEHGAPDHYGALGVPADASQPQIAQAFRRQARTWHPDARPDDSEAPARFRAIVDAYRVLADPRRRARYDRARAAAQRSAERSAPGSAQRSQPFAPGWAQRSQPFAPGWAQRSQPFAPGSTQRPGSRSAEQSPPASAQQAAPVPPSQPSQPSQPTRSARGRPVRVRYIRPADATQSAESSPHIWPVDPRQAAQGRPYSAPQRRRDVFPDDTLRDLIGRLRALLYGGW